MVRAPEQVTTPPVLAPIADSTVAATLPVSVIVTAALAATTNLSVVTKAAVTSAAVPEIVIPAAAAVTTPSVCSPIPDNVVAAIVPLVSLIVTAPVWVPTNPPANAADKSAAVPLNVALFALRVIVPAVLLFIIAKFATLGAASVRVTLPA